MHVSPALLEANQPLGAFSDEKGPPLRQARGLAPLAQHGRLLRHGQEGLGLGKTRGLGFTHAWTEGGWWGGHSCGWGGLEAGGFMETWTSSSDERMDGHCWTGRGSRAMDTLRGEHLKG